MTSALADIETAIKQQRLHGFEQGTSLPEMLLDSQRDFSSYLGRTMQVSTDVLTTTYTKASDSIKEALIIISNNAADNTDKLAKIRNATSDIRKNRIPGV